MSLRFFSPRSNIQLTSSGHSRVKPLENVLSRHNSGNLDCQVGVQVMDNKGCIAVCLLLKGYYPLSALLKKKEVENTL